MGKGLAAASFAASLFALSTFTANAAVVTPITTDSGSFAGTAPTGSALSGFDFFAFKIPFLGSTTVKAQVGTASDSVTFTAFDFFTAPNAASVYKAGRTGTSFDGTSAGAISATKFTGGTYYVGVEATGGVAGANSYAGTLAAVSTVPLPNSVALFGVAVAGLGVAGALRRRKGAVLAG